MVEEAGLCVRMRIGRPQQVLDEARVDLDEEITVVALVRRLKVARAVRDRAERPRHVPAGTAGVFMEGWTPVSEQVAAFIELPAGHPAPDFYGLSLKSDLLRKGTFHGHPPCESRI